MTETTRDARTRKLSQRMAAEIRAEMARQQISGRALALKMERSANWVSLKTSGASPIDLDELEWFSDALGVKVIDLLRRTDPSSYVSVGSSKPDVTSVPMIPLPRGPLATSHPGGGWVPQERRTAPVPAQRV